MARSAPAGRTTRRVRIRRRRAFAVLATLVVIAGAVGVQSPKLSRSTTSSRASAAVPAGSARGEQRDALGIAGGSVPDGTSVFDDRVPGVVNLDPELLAALRRAATDAAPGAVTFVVDSGWRSPAYQAHLLSEAVFKYGSRQEAARWVATPTRSAHVAGDAVDVGPSAAAAWLSQHGAAYGLCQIYANEPWHYELRPEAVARGCPPMYADPTHDPRMQH